MAEQSIGERKLLSRPTLVVPEFWRSYTLTSLGAKQAIFNPQTIIDNADHLTTDVIGVDMGGSKLDARATNVVHPVVDDRVTLKWKLESRFGIGYLDQLVAIDDAVTGKLIDGKTPWYVGISFAGPVAGTKPQIAPNMSVLMRELNDYEEGDFRNVFMGSEVTLINDARGAMLGATKYSQSRFPQTTKRILKIVGTGDGGGDNDYDQEPGHVAVHPQLNTFNVTKPCNMYKDGRICMENVSSGGAIDDIWENTYGERLNGRQISARFQEGDDRAVSLYDSSARNISHGILGQLQAAELLRDDRLVIPEDQLTIICHGGVFEVPSYGQRIRQYLKEVLSFAPQMIHTNEIGDNAGLVGAEYAARLQKLADLG